MKVFVKVVLLSITALLILFSFAFAKCDSAKGKTLFNDTTFAGATSGKSCNSCHPEGKGLENAGDRKEWRMMGKKFKTLEEVINYDIEKAIHGKPIDPTSEDMLNIVAYIKSLKK